MNDGKKIIRGVIKAAGANAGGLAELSRQIGVSPSVISKYLYRGVLPAKVIAPIAALAGDEYTLDAVVMAAYRARVGE